MELPYPPTDNLYKFMALSGITLIAISLIPFLHAHKLILEIIRFEGDVAILSKQLDWMTIDVNELKSETESLKQHVAELKKDTHERLSKASTKENELEIREETKADLNGVVDKNLKLKERLEKIREIHQKQEIANLNQETKIIELKYLNTALACEVCAGICVCVCGIFLAIRGFQLWYKKLQVFQDKLIQRKAGDGNTKPSGNGTNK